MRRNTAIAYCALRALLKVWLTDHPAQANLKTVMLGG